MDLAGSDHRRRGEADAPPPTPTLWWLAAPVPTAVDKFALLPAFLKVRGLVKEHIDSFNYFITKAIANIVKANDLIVALEDPSIYLRYTGVRVGKPLIRKDFTTEALTPQVCRLTASTYSAPVTVDVEYTSYAPGKASQLQRKKGSVIIGYMPIMLRSGACVLNGKDEAELTKYGECPLDPGGYFIRKGNEKVIIIQEQLSKNRIIIETDNKARVTASVVSSTHERKSKTLVIMEKEKIYLQLNQFTKMASAELEEYGLMGTELKQTLFARV